ncbi:MAG: rRNA methyltransferase [Magnetovibrio sp.]|nr:rRNA methyltransferase [Magnetovibrio sp.]MBH90359.1 rRNA methyltransferase [Magnetovibrio sp.]|tara:strand:- start:1023 stop:1604 length:582 start_codon:yes stop_codon:yes gene_type:complete
MRGYFGIGVEGISKAMNIGSIFRTAHAFNASFVFTVGAAYPVEEGGKADTSNSLNHTPFYEFPDQQTLMLPKKCTLVGIELIEDSIELPSFRHPTRAAYVLGPERNSLSQDMVSLCEYVVRIPMQFCVNVSIAAAIVMYDRVQSMGRFQRRPERPGGPIDEKDMPLFGEPRFRSKAKEYLSKPPIQVHPKDHD